MKYFKMTWARVLLIGGSLTLAGVERGSGADADAAPGKSQDLLQKVAQTEMDRRIAIKQTEIDRLKQDLDQSKKDMESLQKNLDSTNELITESGGNLDKLGVYRKLLGQELDLTDLQIDAEERRNDGLKRLSAAQSSALEAMNQRMTEIDVRSQVRQSEVQLLSQGQPVPGEDNDERGSADLEKLRKALSSDEQKTVEADRIAREALKSASEKLASADDAAARAKRMADQMANPEPVAASPTPRPMRRHRVMKAVAVPSATPTGKSASPKVVTGPSPSPEKKH